MKSTGCVLVWMACGFLVATSIKDTASEIIQSNTEFAHALYSELARTSKNKNIVFSPFSIHVALSLAYVGARYNTAREMSAALHLPSDLDKVQTSFQRLLNGVKDQISPNVNLEVANKIYVSKEMGLKKEFEVSAREYFMSEVESVEFGSEGAVQAINDWVEKKTHSKIKNIVSKDSVNDDTKMVLVNAVYFKGVWQKRFNKKETFISPFHTTASTDKNVQTMHITDMFVLVKNTDLGANVLEMDYTGGDASLVIILPFEVDGLSIVENKLRDPYVKILGDSPTSQRPVYVALPKFKLEKSLSLKDSLKALGMEDMWTSSADFSGLTDAGLFVDQVVHKAFIEVDEGGTEAAAATAVLMVRQAPPETFIADHPFVFVLRCKRSGTILFMGRYTDPK